MNNELRAGLWNVLHVVFWSNSDFIWGRRDTGEIQNFATRLWFHYFKKPIDSRPNDPPEIIDAIRKYFFGSPWNEVYDFLEFIVVDQRNRAAKLPLWLNEILEREISGYRFLEGQLVDITSEQEIEMLQEAVADDRFGAVAAHLRRALELYADRESPDYRNSIKESVSAVEAMARVVAENSKAILPDALKALEKGGKLHSALKEGFIKLYGYTSDDSGIRHAMLEEPSLTAADAIFFLLSCTSFVGYLKAQLQP